MKKLSTGMIEEVIRLYTKEKLSTIKIAKKMDVSATAINKLLQKNNIPRRKKWAKTERRCIKCKRVLPLSEFYRSGLNGGPRDYICKECNSEYRKEHPNLENRYKKYGITYEEYKNMLVKQNNRCAICGKKNKGKRFAVDHDHTDGVIRGLLCESCNTGLGLFNDDIELLHKAIIYIENSKT
jgi:ribosomal protein S14